MQHSSPVNLPLHDLTGADPALSGLPAQLASLESVLCTLVVDLDGQLKFSRESLVLTSQRLLARSVDGAWRSWPLSVTGAVPLVLSHVDHAGVGTLALHDRVMRLASWRFTLAVNVQALRLVRLFVQQQTRLAATDAGILADASAEPGLCPECDSLLPPDGEPCVVCAHAIHTPPSTWVLLRLWRFARPYRFQLLSGFLLTLASTAATLVPPYLTIPLMDEVLIPFQNGQQIETWKVAAILGGLLGAA
ncbi:MAG: ABC transporter, partial [Polaromonas sp.]|nr:ABC transporter [Polaromonas sp.]